MVLIGDDDGCVIGIGCLGEVAKAGSDGIDDGFIDGLVGFADNGWGDDDGGLAEAASMDCDE